MKEDRRLPSLVKQATKDAAPYTLDVPNSDWTIKKVNHDAADFFGLAVDKLIGRSFLEFVDHPKPFLAPYGKDIQALLRTNRSELVPVQLWIDDQIEDDVRTVRWMATQKIFTPKAIDVSAQLRAAVEVLPDAFVIYDADDRLVLCNQRYRDIYAQSAPAMVPGETFENILKYGLRRGEYAGAEGREDAWLKERLTAHRQANSTVEQQLADGRWLRILERQTPDGGRVGLRIDITSQIESRNRAERAEQRLRDAIDALPAAFSLHDQHDRVLMFNERFRELFNKSGSKLETGMAYETFIRHGLDEQQFPEAVGREDEWLANQLKLRKKEHYEQEFELGDGRWVKSLNQRTSEGGIVGFRLDITEQKTRQMALERTSSTDDLTGISNRRGVASYLKDATATLDDSERLIFLHIDLDKFKAINDVIGHDAGDFVLQAVTKTLRENIREGDLVARVGGDEFLITLKTKITADAALRFAERLRLQVSEPVLFRGRVCHVGASIGISVWSPDIPISVEQAMLDADIALNDCKSRGRHRCVLFHKKMRQSAVETAELAQQINDGLQNDQFVPWFQPQTDITGTRLDGFEALARWNHPERGVMTAGRFLFAAEDSGLVEDIDRIIIAKTLKFASEMERTKWSHLKFSVNLSIAQLSDPDIVDEFMVQLAAFGLSPDKIRIEILESILLDERSSNVVENIRLFADEGFSIELDDFGTGHTAIASLREFPVNRIKIDRSLIYNIDREPDLRVITDAVTGLGLKLGLEVLAEGVETEEERKILEEIGCTSLQGYYLAPPMPEDDVVCWLDEFDETVSKPRKT